MNSLNLSIWEILENLIERIYLVNLTDIGKNMGLSCFGTKKWIKNDEK